MDSKKSNNKRVKSTMDNSYQNWYNRYTINCDECC